MSLDVTMIHQQTARSRQCAAFDSPFCTGYTRMGCQHPGTGLDQSSSSPEIFVNLRWLKKQMFPHKAWILPQKNLDVLVAVCAVLLVQSSFCNDWFTSWHKDTSLKKAWNNNVVSWCQLRLQTFQGCGHLLLHSSVRPCQSHPTGTSVIFMIIIIFITNTRLIELWSFAFIAGLEEQ